ncbi:MAG: proprotein convertase P-domain-containing protein [Ignavibacteriae bacterium]|nr:proprotein convertase P-domain-containing protein [Ignavibacteriota bacterium]
MKHVTISILFIISFVLMTGLSSTPAIAQYATPTVDGSIGASEYGTHTDGQNQQTNGSQVWYATWDNTNLYVAVSAANLAEGAVIYIDKNPGNPSGNSNGSVAGQNYDGTNFSSLPIRADFVAYIKDGYREYRNADGAGGWGSATSGFGSYASGAGDVREVAIPWSAVTGGTIPSSFSFFSYVTSSGGFVYGQVPTGNAGGTIGTSATYSLYYTVKSTTDGGSTKPFSLNSVDATVGATGATYTTLKGAFDAINAGTLTGTINLYVVDNTSETTADTLKASGIGSASYVSITIKPSGGASRTLSSAAPAGSAFIHFAGADNVTIDGLNSGGNSLTISNTTSSATSGTSTIKFMEGATNNTVTNCTVLGSFSASVATNGGNIFFSTDGTTANGNDNNTISYCNIGPAGSNLPTKGILGNGSTGTTAIGNSGIVIDNNNIYDYFGAAVTSAGVATNGGCNTWTITNNKFYQTATRTWTTGALHTPIYITPSSATQGAQGFTITGNTIGYSSNTQTGTYTLTGSTGKFIGIYFTGITGGTVSNINSNTIASVSLTGVTSSGTGSTSPLTAMYISSGLVNTNSNTIGSQSATGSLTFSTTTTTASDFSGIYNFSSDDWTANNNTIGGISITNLGASGTMTIYGLRANTSTSKVFNATSNNIGGTVANSIQLNATGALSQVIGIATGNAAATWTSNIIRNLTNNIGTGTTTGASVIGMLSTTTSTNHTISQNTIYNLSNTNTTATTIVTGIQFTGSTANTVARNFIYGITSSTNSGSAEINGIRVGGGTTTYKNNMIALGAGVTNAIGSAATNSGTTGINGFNGFLGTDNFWNNSIYIGGSPTSGSGASYAFNGTQTTNTRSFRDNIFVNARSNSGATGKNYAVKINGTTANPTGLTINNNVYYANGSGGVFGFFNSLDVADLAAWKTAVGQDASSFYGDPQYNDPTNATPDLHLHPTNSTVAEGNGVDLGVTDDYDGQTRASFTPVDIGADAGNFTGSDMSAPAIAYTALGNTSNTANRSFTSVTITDASGVNTTAGTMPRVYYKKTSNTNGLGGTNDNTTDGWKYVEANGTSSPFDFTIDYSKLYNTGSVTGGDTVQYFVVAQDLAATPNVAINSGTFAANPTSVALTSGAFPLTGTINSYRVLGTISGTKTVGATGADYTTLTAAVADLNSKELNGALAILINADYANTGETFPITINANSGSSATNTVTIKPNTGVAITVSGSSASSIFKINGADYVIFDGSNTALSPNGTDKSLTISNTSTASSTAAIWVASLGTGAGSTNVTIKNCNIAAGSNTVTSTFGIFVGGASISTSGTGDDNDNLTVNNNSITKAYYGLYARASATGVNNALSVTQNSIGSSTATDYVGKYGLDVTQTTGSDISQNTIFNFIGTNTNPTGMLLGTGVVSTTITRNDIHSLRYTGTTGYGGKGIDINTGSSSSNVTIANNIIYDLAGDGWSSLTSDAIVGIRIQGTTGGLNIYYNSVNLSGTADRAATATLSSALYIPSGVTNIDVRDNIFANSIVNSLNAGAKAYAIYDAGANTVFSTINYNDYYASGTQGILGFLTSDQTTLSAWQTATGQDVNSISADPKFTSNTNLHINTATTASPVSNAGTSIGTVTTDYDGDARHASTPDIGADEFSYPIPQAFTLTSPSGPGQNLSGTLSWASSTNALSYNVYLDQNATPTTLHEGNVAGTTSAYTGLSQNTTYYWDVWAKNSVGDSVKASNGPFSFTTVTPPADPTGLLLSDVKMDSMVVSFTDNAPDGGSTETGFIVYRKAGSAPTVGTGSPDSVALLGANAGTGAVNYQDYGLLPNLNYFYRVASRNAQGESNYTENDTTTLAQTPGAPALTPSGHSIRAVLVPLSNSAATEFTLRFNDTAYVNTSGALSTTPVWGTYAAFGGATGVSVTGLNQGATYVFDAKARNANGYETGFGTQASTTTLGEMSGDYTVGLTMFNSIAGKEITFKKETRKITVTVDELVSEETKTSPAVYKQVEKEVEQEYYVPFENGKVYEGELFAREPNSPNAGVYPTITAAIADLNDRGISGAIRFLLLDATYPTETFPIVINNLAGSSATNTITIKPSSSVVTTISGVSTSGIFKLAGADYVTFDGSNTNGGTTKDMTISNTGTGSNTAAIWLASQGVGAGCSNVTIKNCDIAAGSNTVTSTFGIYAGGTSISTSGTGNDNDNLTITNNSFTKAYYGIYARATSSGVNDALMITQNTIGSGNAADQIGKYGIDANQTTGSDISRNTIFNFIASISNPTGMLLGTGFTNSTVTRNDIHSLKYTGTSGYGGKGIDINTASSSSNVTIANNMIYDLLGDGWNVLSSDAVVGIRVLGTTGGVNIYHNSVNLTGNTDRAGTANKSAALFVFSGTSNLDIRNNLLANSIVNSLNTGSRAYAIADSGSNAVFGTINYNDYYATGTQGVLGYISSTNKTTIEEWRTATGQDANSFATDPLFTSATDLHINNSPGMFSPAGNTGVAIGSVTIDIDGDARSSTPDIGADEFVSPAPNAFTILSPTGASQPVVVVMNWNAAVGATRYDVYAGTDNPPTTQVADNVADTQYTFSGLPNTTYYWNVYAETPDSDQGSRTISSNGPLSFTTVDAPNSPSNLMLTTSVSTHSAELLSRITSLKQSLSSDKISKVEANEIEKQIETLTAEYLASASIEATWIDNASNEDNFYIYRKAGSAPSIGAPYTDRIAVIGPSAGSGGTVNFNDTPLDLNTHYYYRVTAATIAEVESGFAGADTTTLAETPGAPVFADVQFNNLRIIVDPATNPADVEFAIKDSSSGLYINASGQIVSASPVWLTVAGWGGGLGLKLVNLERGTLYAFNVKARNVAGVETGFGATGRQQTTFDQAVFYDYSSKNRRSISDNSYMYDTIALGTIQIQSIKAGIDSLYHTYDGDIDMFLFAPNGDSLELSTDNGGTGENFMGTIFDDAAATSITSGTAPFSGYFRPEGVPGLNRFVLDMPAGDWVLRIYDDATGDTGSIRGWHLTIESITSPNTVTIKKQVDADGDFGTTGDRTAKAWGLSLRTGSPTGTVVASVASDTMLVVPNLLDGTYYAVEEDSASWAHLGYIVDATPTASSANYVEFTMTGGGIGKEITFVNFQPNTVIVRKYADADGSVGTTDDRSKKSWFLALYRGSVSEGNLVASGDTDSLFAGGLSSGTYIAVETDSSGWTVLGHVLNGTPSSNTSRYDTLNVSGGSTTTVDFVNALLNSITVNKYRDANSGLLSKDEARTWFLAVRSGSCSGTIVASGNSTSITASGLPAGTYYVTEADSNGWQHSGYFLDDVENYEQVNCVAVTVGGGQSRTVDFINWHPNTITVRKFRDADGGTPSFDTQLPWGLSVKDDENDVRGEGTSGELVVTDLIDGTYSACEADSEFWSAVGYRIDNGSTVAGSSQCVSFSVSDGQHIVIDFANFLLDTAKFYTVVADSFALVKDSKLASKSIKKKADKVEFTVLLIADSNNVNDVHFEFGVEIDTLLYDLTVTPTPTTLTPVAKSSNKKWDATFASALNAGDTVTISGWGKKGSFQKVSSYWWTRNGALVGKKKSKGAVFTTNQLRLPMPNVHNLGEEIFAQGAFTSTVGMYVGVPRLDAPKEFGWVIHKKYSDVQKSLVKKVKTNYLIHDSTARCFDLFKTGKFLVGKQGSLPPDKYDNKLFAEAIALKLNIAASALSKTPVGFGELKYSDAGHPLDGKMVKEISAYVDTLLTQCSMYGGLTPVGFDSVVSKINAAFAGTFDTLTWSSKLVMKPAVRLSDRTFLVRDPSIESATIVSLEQPIAQTPEKYELYQNYPNPFNPSTMISFDLPEASKVTLKIFNLLGQEVMSVFENVEFEDGAQEIELNASQLSTGVYFYRISATSLDDESSASFSETKKLMLVK